MNPYLLIGIIIVGIIPAIFIIYILLAGISSIFICGKKEVKKDSKYFRFILYLGTFLVLGLLGVRVKINGKEKLPKGRFLLVSNHRSNYDPIVTWWILRKYQLAFISKEANIKIPVFGKISKKCCFLPIDREDPRKAIVTINKSANFIKNDVVSMGVYPEGTRSKTGKLLPFHDGVFKIAQKANVPIVVMTVTGTEKMKNPFSKKRAVIDILEVIDNKTVCEKSSHDLGAEIRQRMSSLLGE